MSDYSTAIDVSTSEDDSWVRSPLKKQKDKAANTVTPRRNEIHCAVEPGVQSPSPSVRRHVKDSQVTLQASRSIDPPSDMRASVPRFTPSRQMSAPSPSKGIFLSGGTPRSRTEKVDKAFKKLSSQAQPTITTPTRPRRVIQIDDSDEEEVEVPTDTELPESPTRISPSVEGPFPLTPDSSQSSMNSLFTNLSVSSSQSSLGSAPTVTKVAMFSRRTTAPAVINDIFHTGSSPNVTHRRQTPKTASKAPTIPYVPRTDEHVPEAVLNFANSPFGTELPPNIIAHCDETQKLFDKHNIAWGTQYELARGVVSDAWTWEDVRSNVLELKGSNAEAAFKVGSVMHRRSSNSVANINLWKELDREQKAIEENVQRGLGLMGDWEGISDWYGGQIQQLLRMVKETGKFKIRLEAMEKRRSHRFARYYGSRRFLQLKIATELLQKENTAVKNFLTRKFILCGRVFIPFHSREEGLYMVETDESYGGNGQSWDGDGFRMSFREFINWHNPLDQQKNYDQVISKYATRFALGLSNSVPALEFEEENIFFIDDITSEEWPRGKPNPPANMLMTDGCGFMNHAALQKIVKYLGFESVPAGVQGRIDGSKGFWILHPEDKSNVPKIWIRTSQNKIKNRSFDRAHRIFDHLGPSKPAPSSAISAQSIINLFSNGIPQQLLISMMEEGLEKEVTPFLEWDSQHAMVHLGHAINKAGNVSTTRTQRLATSLNRALGLKGRDWGHNDVGMEVDDEIPDDDTAALTGRNKYSGGPQSFHEMALEMIQAGFHPATSKYLYDKIKYIILNNITRSVEKYRIPIEESLGAFVVPDPLNVLEEGEIYYRFSTPRKNPRTDMLLYVLEGEVVLGRYPIHLPSDMQKVKAVDRRELDKWPDVVIVSTKGKRSLASLLADGDMDGDELIAIWDPSIVENFCNQPFTNPPDGFMENNFERDVTKVEKFCEEVLKKPQQEASVAFQEVLIANLSESKVGLYSSMHDNAVIKYGYGHEKAVRLAYVFNTLLDASKSGRRLKPNIFESDKAKYLNRFTHSGPTNMSSTFDILSILQHAGEMKGKELMFRYEDTLRQARETEMGKENIDLKDIPKDPPKDKQLSRPYDLATDYAIEACDLGVRIFNDEMMRIRQHVKEAYNLFSDASARERSKKDMQSPSKVKAGRPQKKGGREDPMLAAARAYAQPIEGIVLTRNLEQVKAAYAYKMAPSEAFAFAVAFQELCHIKALTSPGGHVSTLRIFDEAKTFTPSFIRTLNRCDEDLFA